MNQSFDPKKFTKLAGVLKKVLFVFYIALIVGLVVIAVLGLLCVFLPDTYFNIDHFRNGSFSFEMNTMLRYDLGLSSLPGETSLKSLFLSIAISAFVYLLIVIKIFKLIRNLLNTAVMGAPFDEENPKRLMSMGYIILGASFLFPGLALLITSKILDTFMLEGFSLNYSVDLFLFMIGLLLLILAGVFRYGCYLQNEYDETL